MTLTTLIAARAYTARGWRVIPIPHGQKAPRLADWPQLRLGPDDLEGYFANGPTNVGVLLGPASGDLVDIDLDAPEALRLADAFLPPTEACFGRPAKPRSHWLYSAPAARNTRFPAPDGAMLVELRSEGAQTVFPPSTHPSGERVAWATEGPPARVAAEVLHQACRRLAAAALLARAWPQPGGRHHAALALAGALLRAGWDEPAAEAFVQAVVTGAGDDEAADRVRAVRDTAARLAAQTPATGLPTLAEAVGEAVAGRVADWLDLRPPARLVPSPQAALAPEEPGDLDGDYGFAALLAPTWPERFRWVPERDRWAAWDGQRWAAVPEEVVARAAAEALLDRLREEFERAEGWPARRRAARRLAAACSAARIGGTLAFLRGWDGVHTPAARFDADPWVLNCANGVLDLRTGALQPHDPAALCTKLAPIVYDPAAEAPHWEAHLARCLPDPAVRQTVLRHLGTALVGTLLEEVLVLWYGTGANGKTTTVRVVLAVLGDYAARAAPDLLVRLPREARQHPADVADLAGLRLAFAAEVDEGRHLAEARVKELTGGDRLKARHLYESFFEFENSCSLVLVTNHRPRVVGGDDAVWRRLRLIPWTATIPEADRRPPPEVLAALVAEGSGILNTLLEGLRDWQRDPHWVADAVCAASRAYREEEDVVATFLVECCVEAPHATVAKAELYGAFERWCEAVGEPVLSKRTFCQRLRDRGVGEQRTTAGRHLFLGLGLRASGGEP